MDLFDRCLNGRTLAKSTERTERAHLKFMHFTDPVTGHEYSLGQGDLDAFKRLLKYMVAQDYQERYIQNVFKTIVAEYKRRDPNWQNPVPPRLISGMFRSMFQLKKSIELNGGTTNTTIISNGNGDGDGDGDDDDGGGGGTQHLFSLSSLDRNRSKAIPPHILIEMLRYSMRELVTAVGRYTVMAEAQIINEINGTGNQTGQHQIGSHQINGQPHQIGSHQIGGQQQQQTNQPGASVVDVYVRIMRDAGGTVVPGHRGRFIYEQCFFLFALFLSGARFADWYWMRRNDMIVLMRGEEPLKVFSKGIYKNFSIRVPTIFHDAIRYFLVSTPRDTVRRRFGNNTPCLFTCSERLMRGYFDDAYTAVTGQPPNRGLAFHTFRRNFAHHVFTRTPNDLGTLMNHQRSATSMIYVQPVLKLQADTMAQRTIDTLNLGA